MNDNKPTKLTKVQISTFQVFLLLLISSTFNQGKVLLERKGTDAMSKRSLSSSLAVFVGNLGITPQLFQGNGAQLYILS